MWIRDGKRAQKTTVNVKKDLTRDEEEKCLLAEQSKTERLDYVDYLRCFGILLMVMGHVKFGSLSNTWIHAFHMPLWFFISGFFCKPSQNFKSHVLKRVKTILVPYFCFGVGYIVLYGCHRPRKMRNP